MFFLFLFCSLVLVKSEEKVVVKSIFPDPYFQKIVEPDYELETLQWIGGDSSASLEISFSEKDYSIFVYGDSILGTIDPHTKERTMTHFIHNTVGVRNDNETENKKISFFWNEKPEISAMFTPDECDDCYFWLMQIFSLPSSSFSSSSSSSSSRDDDSQDIYIIAPQLQTSGFGAFDFEIESVYAICCKITSDTIEKGPSEWNCEQRKIEFSPKFLHQDHIYFGTVSIALDHGFVYFFGSTNNYTSSSSSSSSSSGMFVSRLSFELVDSKNFEEYEIEYYCQGKEWKKSFISSSSSYSLELLNIEGISTITPETLIYYSLMLERYIFIVSIDAVHSILYESKNGLLGPYSSTQKYFYSVPAPYGNDSMIFCYAYKIHGQYCVDDPQKQEEEIVLTYNCNSFNFTRDYKVYPNLYIPFFMKAQLALSHDDHDHHSHDPGDDEQFWIDLLLNTTKYITLSSILVFLFILVVICCCACSLVLIVGIKKSHLMVSNETIQRKRKETKRGGAAGYKQIFD